MITDLIMQYLLYGHLFSFTIIFFLLDDNLPRNMKTFFLVSLILVLSIYVSFNASELDLFLLFALLLFLSLKGSNGNKVTLSLLSVSIAYIFEWLISWLMIDFIVASLSIEDVTKQLLIFLLIILFIGLLIFMSVWLSRRWLLPQILSRKNHLQLAYLLVICVLIHQAYKLVLYHGDTIFLRLLMGVFYLALVFLIYSVIQTFSKNESLTLTIEKNRLEYELMSKYAAETKKQSLELRKFRHDYMNILSSIEYYLAENKLEELKDFYNHHVKETKSLIQKNILRLDDLDQLGSLEVKSILTIKLITAQEKDLEVQLEISEPIPTELGVDPIVLIRILGILLDNAIEELEALSDKQLLVGVFLVNGDVMFVIQNSARDQIEPLHQLKQSGFSTKGEQRGLGLTNVDELIALEPHLLLETVIQSNKFTQKLTIVKGV